MKLGISMWSYFRAWKSDGLTIPGFIDTARQLGADGVELLDFFWSDGESDRGRELAAVEAALARTGLPVGVYSVANNFVKPDAGERAEQVGRITDGVDMAAHFGARVVRVFAGNPVEGVGFDEALNWIVEGLKAGAQYAGERGITLALENHGLLAGRSDQVLRILDAVGNPALQANPDTGNFLLVHEAPHDAVAALHGRAAMVHFKDFAEVGGDYPGHAYTAIDGLRYKGVALGEGDVALLDCVHQLRAQGFDGWVNIEYEGEEAPQTALPRCVQYARHALAGDPALDPATKASVRVAPLPPLI